MSKVDAAVFDMHLDPVGYVRTDPILDTQCLSNHVHAFYGAKSLFTGTTYNDLRNVDPFEVSGNIMENKSLYWHPAVYHKLPNGNYELQETKLSVYYIWDETDPNVQAFIPNFAMIAGGSNIDSKAALSFECAGNAYNSFPTQPCSVEDEFFIEFKMPNCWNGALRGQDDSHVTYSLDGSNERNDHCPAGFQKIPQLWLFIEFPNGYKGGENIFSDGADVLHVDYFNGWDQQELQNALTNCLDTAGEFDPIGGTRCPQQFAYKNDLLGLSEDVEYAPSARFDTSLITDEATNNVSQPPRGSAKNPDGTCNSNDLPKNLGGSATSPPNSPPSSLPTPPPTPATGGPLATPSPTSPPTSPPTPTSTAPPTAPPILSPTPLPTPGQANPSGDSCVADCSGSFGGDIGELEACLEEFCDVDSSEFECAETCADAFFACEDETDAKCEDSTLELDCVEECEEDAGSSDEIQDCIDEFCECDEDWCTEEQDACYEEEEQACIVQREKCLSAC